MKWVFAVILSTLMVTTLFIVTISQLDQPLQPKLKQIINNTPNQQTSDAYFYLLGFKAPIDEEPIKVGKILFKQIKAQENHIQKMGDFNSSIEITSVNELAELKHELLCRYKNPHCLTTIFSHIEEIPKLTNKNAFYIKRLQQYLAYDDYQTLAEPSIFEPIVNYQDLVHAVRLAHLAEIYNATHKDPTHAISKLFLLQSKLRTQLSMQDTLVGKLIFLSLFSENIDLISLLRTQQAEPLQQTIKPLTQQERDLTAGFNREIASMNHLYQFLDRRPDIFNQVDEIDNFQSPPWLTRMLFKPNMSSNQGYQALDYFSLLSTLTINEFTDEWLNKKQQPQLENSWIRNPIGSILTQVAAPDYSQYIINFWSLNNKINLFNASFNNNNLPHSFTTIKNLFPSLAEKPAYFNDNKQSICFDSITETDTSYRCLRLKVPTDKVDSRDEILE